MEGELLVVVLLLWFGLMAFFIWALVDVIRRPSWQWELSGQRQLVWILVVLFAGAFGPLLYVVYARRKLDDVTERYHEGVAQLPDGAATVHPMSLEPVEILDPNPYLGYEPRDDAAGRDR